MAFTLFSLTLVGAGEASATIFSRSPATDGWNLIGNSATQSTPTFGGWAGGSLVADYNIYSTQFTLSAFDTVSGTQGQTAGDAYLSPLGGLVGGLPSDYFGSTIQTNSGPTTGPSAWLAGDKIIGFGLKWINGQKGDGTSLNNNSQVVVSLDPQGTSTFSGGNRSTSTPGGISFTNNSSSGSFSFSFYNTANNIQNRGPYSVYRLQTGASSGSITTPYGLLNDNGNNRSTIGYGDAIPQHTPNGTLPVRGFSDFTTSTGEWENIQFFINESLMTRTGYGESPFGNSAKWVVTTTGSSDRSASSSGLLFIGAEVPGPLPILGAGAAFGWSRRMRMIFKRSPKPSR
jgi:hypothetical protein